MTKLVHIASLILLLISSSLAKRAAPNKVPPITTEEAVFSVPHFSNGERHQNGGYVEAHHPKTKKLLWRIKIFKTNYNPDLEKDIQDVFINSMSLDKKNNSLIISDEKSRTYILNLLTKNVTRQVLGDNMEFRKGLRYVKGEIEPFTGRVIDYSSTLKPTFKRFERVAKYVNGKEKKLISEKLVEQQRPAR